MNAQDFLKGIDITALTQVSASQLNQLIENSAPLGDSEGEGKGLILWSKDFEIDSPLVPDASETEKWKRYIWLRVRHETDTHKLPEIYAWNDDVLDIPIFLKWRKINSDVEDLTDAIEQALVTAEAAQTTANDAINNSTNAINTATAASALATASNTTANEAKISADAATASLTEANNKAVSAQEAADQANTKAESALATAVEAKTLADANKVLLDGRYISAELSLVYETRLLNAAAHGLGARPFNVWATIICKTTEHGYAVGDEISLLTVARENYGVSTISWDDTTITFNLGSSALRINPKGGGSAQAITAANWRVKVYAQL